MSRRPLGKSKAATSHLLNYIFALKTTPSIRFFICSDQSKIANQTFKSKIVPNFISFQLKILEKSIIAKFIYFFARPNFLNLIFVGRNNHVHRPNILDCTQSSLVSHKIEDTFNIIEEYLQYYHK